MCGCQTVGARPASAGVEADHVLSVSDMSCGHCERRVEEALEAAFPGIEVRASAAAGSVTLRGRFDLDAVHRVIRAAGYTPAA
jgi:copper chaperone